MLAAVCYVDGVVLVLASVVAVEVVVADVVAKLKGGRSVSWCTDKTFGRVARR